MWPHSFHLAIGGALVGVGTDDDELAALLAPLALTGPPDGHDARPPDFGVELHPAPPAHRAAPRLLPSLQHGTRVIGRSTDLAALREGLLRTVAAIGAAVAPGQVRLAGLPLLHDGGVDLAPPDIADRGSPRRLRSRGYTPVHVPAVLIDTATLMVHIPSPLGSAAAPIVAPLRRWWVPAVNDDGRGSAAAATLGHLVAHAAQRLAPPWFDDELDGPLAEAAGTAALTALVQLVQQLPPTLGEFER